MWGKWPIVLLFKTSLRTAAYVYVESVCFTETTNSYNSNTFKQK